MTAASITISDSQTGSTAKIAPELGFNCYDFTACVDDQQVAVLDTSPAFLEGKDRFSGNGIPLLFPYPNRIRGGRYSWQGTDYHVPDSLAGYDALGNAIHGFCIDRPWRVVAQTENSVTGRFQLSVDAADRLPLWPTDCAIEVEYRLTGCKLTANVTIENPGDEPLPWGFGTHPYFRLPLAEASQPSDCIVIAPAAREWVLTDCLPTGEQRPVSPEKDLREGKYFGSFRVDDVQTSLLQMDKRTQSVIMDEQAGLQITQTSPSCFRELVVFTPGDRDAVCLEPYTCATDAINLYQRDIDAGLQVLPPGEKFQTWIEIAVGLIIA